MKRTLYPWILSVVPVAHLYGMNLGMVNGSEVAVAAAATLLLALVAYSALRVMTLDHQRAALLATAAVLAFMGFGHLASVTGSSRATLLALGGALAILAWSVSRWCPRRLDRLTPILNVAALCLLVVPGTRIVPHVIRSQALRRTAGVDERDRNAPKEKNRPGRPDIYYIIADGYPSNAFLLRKYGYDNSRFTSALEELGFFVAHESRSNYGATLTSLASSLNMAYVPENTSSPRVEDTLFLRTLIADNAVARCLQGLGYTYVYLNSGYFLMSEIADVQADVTAMGVGDPRVGKKSFDRLRYFQIDSFYQLALETTPLRVFRSELSPLLDMGAGRPLGWQDRRRVHLSLEWLRGIPRLDEATFTFVHLVVPHGPVRFRRDGSEVREQPGRPTRDGFFEQLEFVNDALLETIEVLVKRSSELPIIVLQADHGSELGAVWTQPGNLTNFEILNAFLVPAPRPARLRANIAPVNSFRILLDEYFSQAHDELPVRHFNMPKGYADPFAQIEVTK